MNYEALTTPELPVLISALYLLGIGLKKSKLPDNLIPLVLGGISIVLSASWVIATRDISTLKDVVYATFASVKQGILSAGTSVYFNQLYLQSKKRK